MTAEAKLETIKIRISPRQKRDIVAPARQRGQSLSALVREGAAVLVDRVAF
jgi:predicted HicB family RNase H-like nuclease